MKISVSYTLQEAKQVLLYLIVLELLFILIYFATHLILADVALGPIRTLFDLNRDLSIPAWFSTIQLFMVSALLFIVANRNSGKKIPSSLFVAAGFVFLFLSMDEGAAVHELVTRSARKMELNWLMFNGQHGAWIAVYAVLGLIGLILAFRYLRLFWTHFRYEALVASAGAVIFGAGAVGLEIISYLFLQSGSAAHKVEVVFEEFFEMSGISIILYAVLLLLKSVTTDSTVEEDVLKKVSS